MKNNERYNLVKKSLENELSVDDYLVNKFNFQSSRVALFKVARFKGRLTLLKSFLFLPIIPFYYLIQLYLSIAAKNGTTFANTKTVFFSFTASPKASELHRDYASDLPYVHCVNGLRLYFAHTLSIGVFLKCYFLSLAYAIRFMFSTRPGYYLHTANIFELVLFSFFLEKISSRGVKSITLTNHYDRWITMIAGSGLFDIHVIQHGLIDTEFYPAHKIDNIKSLTAFSKKQVDRFNSNIYASPVSTAYYLKANLQVDLNDNCDCLIISNPFFIDDELKIYQQLKNRSVDVKFRPHPLFITKNILSEIDERDLCLKTRFPAPIVCIYRDSTLGTEYEMMGFKTYEWDDNTNCEDILATVQG